MNSSLLCCAVNWKKEDDDTELELSWKAIRTTGHPHRTSRFQILIHPLQLVEGSLHRHEHMRLWK
jgi:hypothetical protein